MKLFTKQTVCDETKKQLSSHLSSLTEPQRQDFDSTITLEELTQALDGMDSGSPPGIDGLPAEFYVEFWGLLGPQLMHVLESSLLHGELPLSLRRAVMSLLPKAGDLRHMKNWRPASLLCND